MARGVNRVTLVGHLGGDPELKQFDNGGCVANVSIATTEEWKDKQTGEKKSQTEWTKLVFSNRLAEIAAQYLKKGSLIYVDGKLKTRKWQQDGQDRYATEVAVRDMQMLGGREDNQQGGQQGYQQQSYQHPQQAPVHQGYPQQGAPGHVSGGHPPMDDFDDDIPF